MTSTHPSGPRSKVQSAGISQHTALRNEILLHFQVGHVSEQHSTGVQRALARPVAASAGALR
jgi:hypothetical protein